MVPHSLGPEHHDGVSMVKQISRRDLMRYGLGITGVSAAAYFIINADTEAETSAVGSTEKRKVSTRYTEFLGVRSDCPTTVLSGYVPYDQELPWNTPDQWRTCAGVVAGQNGGSGINCYDGIPHSCEVTTLEFRSDLTELGLHFTNRSNKSCWVTVDDQLISAGPIFAALPDGECSVRVATNFSPGTMRKWRIGLPIGPWRGLSTNREAKLVPTARAFQLAFVSASIIQGIEIQNAAGPGIAGDISPWSPAGQLEIRCGIDVWRMAQAGTGYNAEGPGFGPAGLFGSKERISALASIPSPDLMVVWDTGLSDDTKSPEAIERLVDSAQSCWTAMNQAQPDVPLIVIGTFKPTDKLIGTGLDVANTKLKAAAARHRGVTAFIDVFNESPVKGTGHDQSPSSDGTADSLIASDGIHLTAEGAEVMGEFFARKIGDVLIPMRG